MKRIICAILFVLLIVGASHAQEFSTWTFKNLEVNCIKTGSEAPIDVTKEMSEKTISYRADQIKQLYSGDYITKLSFNGYNLGKDFVKHLRVWMRGENKATSIYDINTDDVSQMTCVFDGDCTIPRGGTKDEYTTLLDFPLNVPYMYTRESFLVIKIECTGEQVVEPLYFETNGYNDYYWPVTTITVQSPVVHFSGCVKNQDGKPIPNAQIHFRNYHSDYDCFAESDEQGYFNMLIQRGNDYYMYDVKAEGCADFTSETIKFTGGTVTTDSRMSIMNDVLRYVSLTGLNHVTDYDMVLYDAIRYYKDEPATIILPITPDATLGRYYRFYRWNCDEWNSEYRYYFEREESPMANVPYVIFPNNDFDIYPGDYDTADIDAGKCKVVIEKEHPYYEEVSATFQGTYQNSVIYTNYSSEVFDFIYKSPDCMYFYNDVGRLYNCLRAGAFRAYFSFWGPNYMSYRSPCLFVFNGEQTGIVAIVRASEATVPIFDLQGRRLTDTPQRGMYIRDGKKYVVK